MATREDKAYKKHYERETESNRNVRKKLMKPIKGAVKAVKDFVSTTKKKKEENKKNKATLSKPKKQGY
tara:strand:- start:697 stop:900 length:204 start_codon:yes stop_codon:yes gene_type:complete